LEEVPSALRTAVDLLGSRKRTEDVRRVIEDLCRWRACHLDEIAGWLGRNPEYLRQAYIAPMLREGVLVYTIPTVKYHPDQAYRAAETQPGPD